MEVTAVFDIGKTHKKFILLDDALQLLAEESCKIEEIEDDDGFPCDDLDAICEWVINKVDSTDAEGRFTIKRLNFSTYGASFVHLDQNDKPLTPLYNYLKPLPKEVEDEFYQKYGPAYHFAIETSSPTLGMLNSGLQLYWLKKKKPEVFNMIVTSLHLPNYLAYLFHGRKLSDLTSIGCHTALWDFKHNRYHSWVKEEGVIDKLPHLTSSALSLASTTKSMEVGVGLHDSSAALIPYLVKFKDPFILLSTGTWNICLNPFNCDPLNADDLSRDSLHFFSFVGKPIMANRLFLGNEHDILSRKLSEYFNKNADYHKNIRPDKALTDQLMVKSTGTGNFDLLSYFSYENSINPLSNNFDPELFTSYEDAYHDLMLKLAACQVKSIEYTLNEIDIKDIYITGGFIDNDLFTYFLARHFNTKNVYNTSLQEASAMGAALVMDKKNSKVDEKFIRVHKINP